MPYPNMAWMVRVPEKKNNLRSHYVSRLVFFLDFEYIKSQELEVSVDRQKETISVGERYQIIPVY
jgi:hypothetical protein